MSQHLDNQLAAIYQSVAYQRFSNIYRDPDMADMRWQLEAMNEYINKRYAESLRYGYDAVYLNAPAIGVNSLLLDHNYCARVGIDYRDWEVCGYYHGLFMDLKSRNSVWSTSAPIFAIDDFRPHWHIEIDELNAIALGRMQ